MSNHFTGLRLGPPADDPRLDLTDLFAFQAPADPTRTVLILNSNTFGVADAFHPDAVYRINVDNDGDGHSVCSAAGDCDDQDPNAFPVVVSGSGSNTYGDGTDQDPYRTIEHALENLDHLVVVDLFLTETAELADVVLPASAWAETDGVFVNTERRIQRVRAAVPPQGDAKPEWWIIAEIAKRLGTPGF